MTVLFATALLGTTVIMGPTLFLLWLQPKWFRWINDRLMTIWLALPPVGILIYAILVYCSFSPFIEYVC